MNLSLKCLTDCMWLFQEFGKGSSASRCDLKENLLNGGCSNAAVEFPSSTLTIHEDAPLSDKASGTADDVTQIRPQKLHMTLRPGTFTPIPELTSNNVKPERQQPPQDR